MTNTNKSASQEPLVDHLDLRTQVTNALWRNGFDTVEKLLAMTSQQVHDLWNVGSQGRDEINRALRAKGFLRPDEIWPKEA